MKIVEQKHQFVKEKDPLKLIEACGRICYKSENKITEDSAKRFVQMITRAGHYSVLEHASICFEVNQETIKWIRNILWEYESKDGYFNEANYFRITDTDRCLISGNFRCWLDFFNAFSFDQFPLDIKVIYSFLTVQYPNVFQVTIYNMTVGYANVMKEEWLSSWEKEIHATRTCRFITNRGVTHEMVRHRPWAYSQESTRYVRYDGNMEFILPVWFDPIWAGDWFDRESAWQSRFGRKDEDWMAAPAVWLWACEQAELNYQSLISTHNQRPEQARGVLPNDLKTEIVCTAPLAEWKHMLGLRTSKAAHPQIRHLLIPVLEELQKELPEIFFSYAEKV